MGALFLIPFLLFPIASLLFLVWASITSRFKDVSVLFYISLALGLLGYAYVPNITNDIYRHYLTVQSMNAHGDAELLARIQEIGGPAFFYLIAYICGALNIYNLLPMFVVTASYFMYLCGLREVLRNSGVAAISVFLLPLIWIFGTLSYPFIMTNLRQPFAVACVYYVLMKPKSNIVLIVSLLAAALLFHVTGVLMIACLGLAYLWDLKRFQYLTMGIVSIVLLVAALNLFGYDLGIAGKVELYLGDTERELLTFEVFWRYVTLSFLNAATFIVLAAQVLFIRSHNPTRNRSFADVPRKRFGRRFPSILEMRTPAPQLAARHRGFRNMPIKQYYSLQEQLSTKFSIIFFGVSMLFVNNLIVYRRLMFYLPLFSASMIIGYLNHTKRDSLRYFFTLGLLLLSTAYAVRLQWANFGGHEYWPGVFYRDVFSILINARNYFFIDF
jgi:hypothetical protein